MALQHVFHPVDYAIFIITIIISLGIGVYYAMAGGTQKTTSDYFVASRKMSFIPVAVSLMVSFESSIMMLGTPAEVYVYGVQWMIVNIGYLIANTLSIIIVVPLIHPLKITSSYEYLEYRFESHAVRILGTILGILSNAIFMGIVLFGPAIALEAVIGVPLWLSIIVIALASTIYTSVGGLKAVIWTDSFQSLIMLIGFLAVIIKGTLVIGGVGKTWDIAYKNGRINLFNFDPDPTVRHTFWNLFFGSIIRGFGLTFNQSTIQRLSSIPTLKDAKRVLLLMAPGHFLALSLAVVEGVIAYAYFHTRGCDPIASEQIANPNQVVPTMVMDMFHNIPGAAGLFLATVFSASLRLLFLYRRSLTILFSMLELTTLDSGLSSMSAQFWTDLVKPHIREISEDRALLVSKIAVFGFGMFAVLVAFMIDLVGGTLIQITGSMLSAVSGPLTGLFLFGAFCPWGNAKGAFWGTVISAACSFTLSLGQMTTDGAKRNYRLPAAPTDQCALDDGLMGMDIVNGTVSMATVVNATLTGMFTSTIMNEVTTVVPEPVGFSRIFMVSYQWFGAIGVFQTIIYGSLISLCTGYKRPGEVDRKYLIPFYDSLCPFLPECIRRPLRCGYDHELLPTTDHKEGEADNQRKPPINEEV